MLLLDIRKVKQTDGFYLLEVEKIISETSHLTNRGRMTCYLSPFLLDKIKSLNIKSG